MIPVLLFLDHTRILVEAIVDCVPAYARMAQTLQVGQALTIAVHHPRGTLWPLQGY